MSIATPNEGIELLYTRDCQAWPQALENLKLALSKANLAEKPKLIPIETETQAELYNFFASPTIHIDGVDIDPSARRISRRGLGRERPYFYNKQAYRVPPVELILAGLRELYGA